MRREYYLDRDDWVWYQSIDDGVEFATEGVRGGVTRFPIMEDEFWCAENAETIKWVACDIETAIRMAEVFQP